MSYFNELYAETVVL